MSEEATQLEEKKENSTEVDAQTKTVVSKQDMSGPLNFLILFSLPFGYFVSSLPGQYATHATFAMVALFIICSLSNLDKASRFTGILFALLWTCAGILFYSMRGI